MILNWCWYTSIASGNDGIKQRAWKKPNIGRPIKIKENDYGNPNNLLGPINNKATEVTQKQVTNYSFLGTFLNANGITIADVR